jgi:RNA polymerase sigma factor (sigma-70 family)
MAAPGLCALLGHLERLTRGPCHEQRTDRQLLEYFATSQDETAFAELVARHGPLVLRVCRRVLGHEQDAEDAFQATFLVLAQHFGSIRKRESLTAWFYGVAYRTAMKAKRSAARRRNHEASSSQRTRSTTARPSWDDVQAVLDEEIERLPATFRAAFVLCVLEGKTVPAAAEELKCKEGTVSSRLTRARQRLQQQLAQRGIRLSAVLAALSVADSARATVPSKLVQTTIRLGLVGAAGGPAAEQLPPDVAALAAGVTRAMFLQKARIATLVLLIAGLVAAGVGVLTHQALAAREQPVASPKSGTRSPASRTPAEDEQGSIAYSGRVLGPDGRPVSGARLSLTRWTGRAPEQVSPLPESGTSGPDGRFAFTVPKAQFDDHDTVVTATAANYGVGWVDVPPDGKRDDLTVRLVADDVPITGQVLDLEGKPIQGVTLRLLRINAARGEDLGPWLEAARGKKGLSLDLELRHAGRYHTALPIKVTTDGQGRFRLTGIGPNRLVRVQLDGPTIASEKLHIFTRPEKTITLTRYEGRPEYDDPRIITIYYGASFQHAAQPTRPIIGVVRDKDTKKPLAGFQVRSDTREISSSYYSQQDTAVWTTTDAQGRYRLIGLPKGAGFMMAVHPADDQPYVATSRKIPDSPGLDPVTVDVELKRGVWIEGKLTDKASGKPLKGAVEYFSMYSNPNLADYPGLDFARHSIVAAKEDGSYRVAGLPGPGVLGVYYQRIPYLRAPDRDDEFGTKEKSMDTTPYAILHPSNFNALARIEPARGVEKVVRDVTLDPGWSARVSVLGPDGKPLAGVRTFGLTGWRWDREGTKPAEFTMWFNPHQQHNVLLMHFEKGLVGVVQTPKENCGSITVRMEPGATATGRLVDAEGQPRANVELEVTFHPWKGSSHHHYSPDRIKTDREGRFRIGGLLPGCEYRLADNKGELDLGGELRSGQTKDLGDVQMKQPRAKR